MKVPLERLAELVRKVLRKACQASCSLAGVCVCARMRVLCPAHLRAPEFPEYLDLFFSMSPHSLCTAHSQEDLRGSFLMD